MGIATTLLTTRALRAVADGFVAVLLPLYLTGLGFNPFQVGLLSAATLGGSALLTLAVGLTAHRVDPRKLLLAACLLMALTGLAFAAVRDFWPLLAIAFVGTLNPSAGDNSLFLPLEHSLLAHAGPDARRTHLFGRYALVASLAGAVGSLAAGAPVILSRALPISGMDAIRAMFLAYSAVALVALLLYRRLPPQTPEAASARTALGPSRKTVMLLAGLFSLDAFGGGFFVQSLMALWLYKQFGLSAAGVGALFFWTGVLGAGSLLAAARLSNRIGLVRTMVFTHIPASLCIIIAAFSHSLPLVIGLLLVRACLSQMDVPARGSYVMAIVTPAERAAAASFTAVPRSLAGALSPAVAGWMMMAGSFAAPLVIGGGLKIAYDLLLLLMFRNVRRPEETKA
ncbi:MAG: major facilitator superfamily protein [Caulobacter sp.]|nr:major facilitator superfamily protein [Caulobacter sp.]